MTLEQEADAKLIQAQIHALMASLYEDMSGALKVRAFGSVEGLAFQISQLAKAHGCVGAAAFQKNNKS